MDSLYTIDEVIIDDLKTKYIEEHHDDIICGYESLINDLYYENKSLKLNILSKENKDIDVNFMEREY